MSFPSIPYVGVLIKFSNTLDSSNPFSRENESELIAFAIEGVTSIGAKRISLLDALNSTLFAALNDLDEKA
jgi:hypothetical protein